MTRDEAPRCVRNVSDTVHEFVRSYFQTLETYSAKLYICTNSYNEWEIVPRVAKLGFPLIIHEKFKERGNDIVQRFVHWAYSVNHGLQHKGPTTIQHDSHMVASECETRRKECLPWNELCLTFYTTAIDLSASNMTKTEDTSHGKRRRETPCKRRSGLPANSQPRHLNARWSCCKQQKITPKTDISDGIAAYIRNSTTRHCHV